MEEKKNIVPMGDDHPQREKKEVHNRPGSTEHNDYRITGKNDGSEKDAGESYQDYNGNSESTSPDRS